jgi:hypothetical protein
MPVANFEAVLISIFDASLVTAYIVKRAVTLM